MLRKEDEAHDRRQREKREAREAAVRERAEAEVAEVRATYERQARLAGVPSHQIREVVDRKMLDYHAARLTGETPAEQTQRELRAYFAARGTAIYREAEGAS